MDKSSLDRVASGGLNLTELDSIRDWCWEWGVATGDARYCVLWRVFDTIRTELDHAGFFTKSFSEELDRVLGRELPAVLDAEGPMAGALLASSLEAEVGRVFAHDQPPPP